MRAEQIIKIYHRGKKYLYIHSYLYIGLLTIIFIGMGILLNLFNQVRDAIFPTLLFSIILLAITYLIIPRLWKHIVEEYKKLEE